MPMPHRSPALGSRPRLYRVVRDNAYYVAGTIVCLDQDEVSEINHERIHVHLEEEVEALLSEMQARLDAMEAKCAALMGGTKPPEPEPAPEPTKAPEPKPATD